MTATVRWRSLPTSPLWRPKRLQELRAACVQLKTHFLDLGGTTVSTPGLRTVIQADGDVLCFFDEERTRDDDALWRQHIAAVKECTGGLAAAITSVEALLRGATVVGALAASVLFCLFWQRPWAVLIGLAAACAGLGAAWAGRVTRQALAARNQRHASVIGRVASLVTLALVATAATVLSIDVLALRDLIIAAAALIPAILGSWLFQWLARRGLGIIGM